jgi:glycosyltransferase involved in cell wall biosynthesis
MHVIHVFDKFINSGVHSAASSIYKSIKYVNPSWEQSVAVFSPEDTGKKVCPPWFFVQGVVPGLTPLYRLKKERGDKVLVLHRAMRTPVIKMIRAMAPFGYRIVVVSHTLSPSASSNHFGNCDLVIAVSCKMGEILSSSNPTSRLEIVHNFSEDTEVRWNHREKDSIIFGRVNSLNKIKHSARFISWFKSADFSAPATLRYVGSGGLLEDAKKCYEKASGLNKIDFLGWFEGRDRVLEEMSSWDAMLYHINEPEGTSMAVIDAMAIGMPIITSDLPGNNEMIVHRKNGMLFSSLDSVPSMVNVLRREGEAKSIGIAARQSWETGHSLLVGGRRYCDLLTSLVSAPKSIGTHSPKKSTRTSFAVNNDINYADNLKKCESFLSSNSAYVNAQTDSLCSNHVCLLIACRNKGSMLSEALVSISRQVYRNISVSFVDDASSDASRDVWARHMTHLTNAGIECRYRLLDQHVGYASSLGIALSMSPKDCIVGILDADDALPINACAALSYVYSSKPHAGFVWTQFVRCNEHLKPFGTGFSSSPSPGKSLLESEHRLSHRHCYSHWKSFRRFDGDHEVFATDVTSAVDKFIGYALEERLVGHFANIPLYLYRCNTPGSITKQGTQGKNWKIIREQAENRRKSSGYEPKGFI